MKVSNITIIATYVYIIIFFSLFFLMYTNYKIDMKKEMYQDKIRYAIDSSGLKKFDMPNDDDIEELALGNTLINYNSMYDEFVRVLKLNFKNNYDLSKYLDKYMVVTNDGLVINYKDQNDNRLWSDVIPYSIDVDHDVYTFKLNDADYYVSSSNIKKLAIINTIRRNLIIDNDNSTYFKIPYDDNTMYNTILNQSIIATFTNCPIINNKEANIVVLGGSEFKDKNIYFINDNNRYEKINYKNINDDMILFDNKKDAGLIYYPEIYGEDLLS